MSGGGAACPSWHESLTLCSFPGCRSGIVRHGEGYELLPRAAADKVRERDAAMIVLDHGQAEVRSGNDADDEYYKRFEVPDDLIW